MKPPYNSSGLNSITTKSAKQCDSAQKRILDVSEMKQINLSMKSNLFATKQMNNFYSKARSTATGHKGSVKTALTSALIIQIKNNITR